MNPQNPRLIGLSFQASANKALGNANGDSTTYTNTHVQGQQVQMDSGGDTTIKGGVVTGQQVTANVGGNLNIESLQDSNQYKEKSQQIGGSVTIGPAPAASLSLAATKINSNYLSVTEQSGIKTGDGGFTVNVGGNTALVGGAITSTQAAIDNNKNSFQTGGKLTTSDIQNTASYDAKSISVTVSASAGGAGLSAAGLGGDSGSAASTTTAGISGIAGDKAKRTGDKEQGIAQIFNKDKVKADVTAQVAITQEFGKNASKAVGDYAATKLKEAEKNNDQAGIEAWKEGGANRVALHTLVGGLTGGAAGAVGAGSASAAAPAINELQTNLQNQLVAAGVNPGVAQGIASLASGATAAAIGSVASGGTVAGGATAFNADMNNRQLHPTERQKAKNLAAKSGGKYTAQQIEDAMRTASNTESRETPASNMIIDPSKDKAQGNDQTDAVASSAFDKGAVFNNFGGAIVQVDRNGQPLGSTPVSAELMGYIQANTGGASSPYKWVTPQADTTNPNAGLNTITPASNGCVTAACSAGLTPDKNPIRDSTDVRNDVADGAGLVGRRAGVISNTATAIEVGSPDPRVKIGAAAVGITATAIDFASKVVEQVARPDTGKGAIEVGATMLGDIANKVAPIAAPISNEIIERMKDTNEVKNIQEKIGK